MRHLLLLSSLIALGCSSSESVDEGLCGDSAVTGNETCDDGNADDTDVLGNCRTARCGDGYVQDGVEGCDDGNTIDVDAHQRAVSLRPAATAPSAKTSARGARRGAMRRRQRSR